MNAELLPADCTIREAEPGDIPAMLGLERRSMRAQVERLCPGRWDERELRETAAARLATARVAARGATLLGFCRWETRLGYREVGEDGPAAAVLAKELQH